MTERRIIVDAEAESDDRLGYALAHIDGTMAAAVAELKRHIDATLEAALDEHSQRLAEDSDYHLPPMARRAADVVTNHWWDKFSKRFTLAVLMAGLAVLLAGGTYLAARLGVLK